MELSMSDVDTPAATPGWWKDPNEFTLIVLTGEIFPETRDKLKAELETRERTSNALVVLTTSGGEPVESYRIGALLLRMFKQVTVFVPRRSMSAGTILAAAGHSLVMSNGAEIGPTDAQRLRKGEVGFYDSSLASAAVFDAVTNLGFAQVERIVDLIRQKNGSAVTFASAASLGAEFITPAMRQILSTVDAAEVGVDYRATAANSAYLERLSARSRNLKDGAVQALCHQYPLHNFPIDFGEAESLFANVFPPNEVLQRVEERLSRAGMLDEHENQLLISVNPSFPDADPKLADFEW
jgi:hypothetical protein